MWRRQVDKVNSHKKYLWNSHSMPDISLDTRQQFWIREAKLEHPTSTYASVEEQGIGWGSWEPQTAANAVERTAESWWGGAQRQSEQVARSNRSDLWVEVSLKKGASHTGCEGCPQLKVPKSQGVGCDKAAESQEGHRRRWRTERRAHPSQL